jgi:hypothetical protein
MEENVMDFYNQLNEDQKETLEMALDVMLGQSDDNDVYNMIFSILNRIQL